MTQDLDLGVWTGCFTHLTSFTLDADTRLFAELRLDKVVLPGLVEFNLGIRTETFVYTGRRWGPCDFTERRLLGIKYIPAFINNYRATLRNLGLRNITGHGIEAISNLVGSIDHLPELETLEVIGVGCDMREMKLPLQNFVEGHLSQLKELSIGLSDGETWPYDTIPESHFQQFFDTVPSLTLSLTRLKLGIRFELSPQFFEWAKPVFPQLVTLWISRPIFDQQNLKQLLSLVPENCEAASGLPGLRLRHLLLRVAEPTESVLLDLSRTFPRLQTLRLLFNTVLLKVEPKDYPGHDVRFQVSYPFSKLPLPVTHRLRLI